MPIWDHIPEPVPPSPEPVPEPTPEPVTPPSEESIVAAEGNDTVSGA